MKPHLNEEDYRRELAEIARFPDMNPGSVLRMNFEGEVLLSNVAAQKLFGQDLHGKNWKDICPEMSTDRWNEIISSAEIFQVEASIADKCFVFTHRPDSKTSLVFVYGADITQNKLYELKLEEQKNIIEEIARFPYMNPGPVIRMDFNGKISLLNVAAQQVFGGDLLGKNWRDICKAVTDETWNKCQSTSRRCRSKRKTERRWQLFNISTYYL